MTEAAAVYFEDHKEASDLGRLAVRGGIVSVAMQYGNATGAAVVMTSLLLAVPSISYVGCPIGAACGGWWFQTTALTHYSGLVRIFLSTGICVSIYLIMVACFGIPSRLRSQSQSCGIFWEGDSGGQSYARGKGIRTIVVRVGRPFVLGLDHDLYQG